MWCFIDESYPTEGGVTAIVACLMQSQAIRKLDREMFVARRTHFGEEHARDLNREIKGSEVLSRQSFRCLEKYGHSKNHALAEDVLNACVRLRTEHPILLFGAVVYGAKDVLTKVTETKLIKPLTHILNLVSTAACRINRKDRVNLVFDEQIGTRADVAIRTRRFVAGVNLPNVSHYPLSAVSNTSPGIQLADIGAYILGRQAVGDPNFVRWMTKLRPFEWRGHINDHYRRGFGFFEKAADGKLVRRGGWKRA